LDNAFFMKVDTLIIGFGIAGLNYAEQLKRHKKSFVVVAQEQESASHIAAGIVNPTVLKRFNPVWKANDFIEYALPLYSDLEKRLQTPIIHPLPIYRILNNIQEQNDWRVAASRTSLEKYLNKQLISKDKFSEVKASFSFGEVIQSARVDIKTLLTNYSNKIIPHQFISKKLDHKALILGEFIEYKNIKARQIVFCEGYKGVKNPYFNYLPLIGSKGEILIIKCDQLTEEVIFKGPIFLSPMGNKTFWVGATFERKDKTTTVTDNGKDWLVFKLKQFLKLPFQILDHKAQIRATVIDRRPLLGRHPIHENIYLLNGVGTRGALMSPLLSNWLFRFIENNEKLPPEADIKRFEKQYFRNSQMNHG
jgi:glycine oxidase